jgi:hypothetical protein
LFFITEFFKDPEDNQEEIKKETSEEYSKMGSSSC